MASAGPNHNSSQFYITTVEDLHQLDEKHTIFGVIAEGLEVVSKINEVFTDAEGRPLQVVRIKHTIILEDPFPDPKGLEQLIPDSSPLPPKEQWENLLDEEEMEKLGKPDERTHEEVEEEQKEKEAQSREDVLVMISDIPEYGVKPPDNVLFVCKLNPITTEEDLELIFSRFGEIKSCEVIKDWKTGDSLCYAFLEFSNHDECEQAYFKMDNVLIDDRRIHVDFSQSVSKLVRGTDGRAVRLMNNNWKGQINEPKSASNNPRSKSSSVQIKNNSRSDNYDLVFDSDQSHKRKHEEDSHHRDSRKEDKKSKSDYSSSRGSSSHSHHRDDHHRHSDRHYDDRSRDKRDNRHK